MEVEQAWNFEELDLQGAYEEMREERDMKSAVSDYLFNKFMKTKDVDSELYKFLDAEFFRVNEEAQRLGNICKSILKVKNYDYYKKTGRV